MRAKFRLLFLVAGILRAFFAGVAHADPAVATRLRLWWRQTLDGKNFDLSALKGKVVVVHFWATWCPTCHEEMPVLEAVWRQYHGKGMEVLAISADRPRTRSDVVEVMHYFTFPASILASASKNDFGNPSMIPVTYVIDKDGKMQNIMTPGHARH